MKKEVKMTEKKEEEEKKREEEERKKKEERKKRIKKWIGFAVLICLILGGIYYYQSTQIKATPPKLDSLKGFEQSGQNKDVGDINVGAADKPSDIGKDQASEKIGETEDTGVAGASKIKPDLSVENIEQIMMKGSKYSIGTLNFEFDGATTPASTIETLVKDVSVKLEGKTKIVIVGHTDSVGSEIYNQGLSERRAMFVADKMRESEKSKSTQFGVIGYGKTKPIADNASEAGRAKNRRVEIYVE